MPGAWFRSEYLCEFTDTLDSVFRYEDIQAAFSSLVEPLTFGPAAGGVADAGAAIDDVGDGRVYGPAGSPIEPLFS